MLLAKTKQYTSGRKSFQRFSACPVILFGHQLSDHLKKLIRHVLALETMGYKRKCSFSSSIMNTSKMKIF